MLTKKASRAVPRAELQALVALIATKRQKLGMSQRELSRRVGLWPMAIMELERGDRGLQVTELIDIAKVLGEDPLELLRGCLAPTAPKAEDA